MILIKKISIVAFFSKMGVAFFEKIAVGGDRALETY